MILLTKQLSAVRQYFNEVSLDEKLYDGSYKKYPEYCHFITAVTINDISKLENDICLENSKDYNTTVVLNSSDYYYWSGKQLGESFSVLTEFIKENNITHIYRVESLYELAISKIFNLEIMNNLFEFNWTDERNTDLYKIFSILDNTNSSIDQFKTLAQYIIEDLDNKKNQIANEIYNYQSEYSKSNIRTRIFRLIEKLVAILNDELTKENIDLFESVHKLLFRNKQMPKEIYRPFTYLYNINDRELLTYATDKVFMNAILYKNKTCFRYVLAVLKRYNKPNVISSIDVSKCSHFEKFVSELTKILVKNSDEKYMYEISLESLGDYIDWSLMNKIVLSNYFPDGFTTKNFKLEKAEENKFAHLISGFTRHEVYSETNIVKTLTYINMADSEEFNKSVDKIAADLFICTQTFTDLKRIDQNIYFLYNSQRELYNKDNVKLLLLKVCDLFETTKVKPKALEYWVDFISQKPFKDLLDVRNELGKKVKGKLMERKLK